ncbi:protein D7-like [Lytechinus pictus]|uniref:protein D7-like n=1 Tax=Lytechinus pictus TaxID=7653 RepID=UPI0030BA241F
MPGRRGVFDAIMTKEDYMQPEQKAVPVKLAESSINDPDELIECPYDKVHRIRLGRFPMHLLKCRKNYTGKEMFTCPFNACHLVPAPEARHHVANCPDKACVEKEMMRGYDANNTYCKGYTKSPAYKRTEDFGHKPSENWDEEIRTDQSREYWGPEEGSNRESNHLPRAKGRGAPRAIGQDRSREPVEMRLPRQPAQAAAVAQQRHQQLRQQQYGTVPSAPEPQVNGTAPAPVQPSAVAGLGRGQFKGRVMAANLWGAPPQQNQQPSTKPGGLAQSSWAMHQASSGNSSSGPPSLEDDFPPLGAPQQAHIGLGRGLGRGKVLQG